MHVPWGNFGKDSDGDKGKQEKCGPNFLFPAGGSLLCTYIHDNVSIRLYSCICCYAVVPDSVLLH